MIRYKPRGQYSGVMDEHKDGPFVLHVAAQAEIDALHAECDRLMSMLEPQKVLEADEVKYVGMYWHRFPPAQTWRIVMINDFEYLRGEFIGPLKAPEGL